MTEQEAINELKFIKICTVIPEEKKAIDMAIKALEKQIPKKPNWGNDDQDYVTCPQCNAILGAVDNVEYTAHQKYCPNCGQKLDWE